jgi:hypothetical protein
MKGRRVPSFTRDEVQTINAAWDAWCRSLPPKLRAKVEAAYEIERTEHEDTHSARALLCAWFISTYDGTPDRENPAQIDPDIIAARTGYVLMNLLAHHVARQPGGVPSVRTRAAWPAALDLLRKAGAANDRFVARFHARGANTESGPAKSKRAPPRPGQKRLG